MIDIDVLINEVEKEESLWNINSKNYMDKHYKTKAWINVASAWKNIRDNFARDIKQNNSTPSGSGANSIRNYAYADVLSFLQPDNR
ncbi:Uncharacterized protein FWK35_00028658 [Aphis craccivora]|uniref:MADF domain-containing protein n=1 Tax=Aphis craccivora TaxID=307492 RepID=A0A6G0WDX4_APHCR|nr:Uncharacterized protein FWK35_00028658 [Aphis craccivora]